MLRILTTGSMDDSETTVSRWSHHVCHLEELQEEDTSRLRNVSCRLQQTAPTMFSKKLFQVGSFDL